MLKDCIQLSLVDVELLVDGAIVSSSVRCIRRYSQQGALQDETESWLVLSVKRDKIDGLLVVLRRNLAQSLWSKEPVENWLEDELHVLLKLLGVSCEEGQVEV